MGQQISGRPVILFTSLLKPCDDVRVSQRLFPVIKGLYLQARIISIGPTPEGGHLMQGLETIGLFSYKRDLFSRLKHSWKLFQFSLKVKPEFICVNCTELLWVGLANKILFGSTLVFDLQENEALNRASGPLNPGLKPIAAALALMFHLFKPMVNRFWIAEEVYQRQLSLPKAKTTYLPNVLLNAARNNESKSKTLEAEWLLTGTISVPFGALQALDWCKELRIKNPKGRLLIAGHCPDRMLKQRLEKEAENNSWIHVHLSLTPLPHTKILAYLDSCEMLLAPYQDLACIRGKYPSKFREAAAANKPVLCPDFEEWRAFKHEKGPLHETLILLPDQDKIKEEALQFEMDLKHELKILGMA